MADPDEYQRQQKELHLLRLFPEALQARQRGSSVLQTLCRKTDLLHGEAEYHAEKLQRPPSGELDRSRKRIMASSGNFSMVCRVCSKEFPSGRALGGHMRVHGGLFAEPIRAAERSHHDRKQLSLIRNRNSTEQDRDSGFKEGLRSGSGLQSSKVLLDKGLEGEYEEPFMEEEEEEEEDVGAFEVAATVSSESGYDDDKLFCDDQFRMISRSHSKERRLGSLKFISNPVAQQNRELLGDGLKVSSESKRNSLYELRHNPKRSRLLTDQEFDGLEVQAGNSAMADFSTKRLSSSSPERTRACSCPVCGKEFWSQKALFGHMRCHPEREWRGIQPPETTSQLQRGAIRFVTKNQPAASLSSFAEESEIEIQSDLENKDEVADKKEGKEKPEVFFKIKGPSRTQNAKEPVQEEGKPRLHSAIKELDIKNLTNTAPWPTSKRSKRRRSSGLQEMSSTPETVLTSETTSMEVEEEHEKEGTEKHQKANDEVYLACCLLLLSAGQTDAGLAFFDSARAQEESEQTGFESGDDDLESKEDDQLGAYDDRYARNLMIASSSDIKYECSTCKRCFNSPQALGGHRASHKKMKGCYAREEVPVVSNWKDSTEEDPELNKWQPGPPHHVVKFEAGRVTGREEEKKNKKIKGHECSICHRIFSTGQALGGHKRCHWISEKTQDCTASANNDRQLSLSLIEGGQSTMLKEEGMGIDLNLPAPLDEEEDEAGYSHNVGYGYNYGCGHGSAELRLLPEKLVDATAVGEEKGDSLVEIANKSSVDVMSPVNWRVMDCFGGHGESSLAQTLGFDGLTSQLLAKKPL